MQTIQFYYNKRIVYQTIIVGTFLSLFFLYKAFHVTRIGDIILFALTAAVLFISTFFIAKRHLLPALKSQVAIELTEKAIVDHCNGRIIRWDEIEGVAPVRQFIFKKHTGIAIDLYDEKRYYNSLTLYRRLNAFITKMLYQTPLVIHFILISYDKEEIVLTFQDCFKKIKKQQLT